VCCAEQTSSIYWKNETEPKISEEKSVGIPFSQILVGIYLVLVAAVFICDLLSHMKLKKNKNQENNSPESREASLLLEKFT
jgi:hypothetical protein